jgi:hypothetical protein
MQDLFKINQDFKGWPKGALVLYEGLETEEDYDVFGERSYSDIGYELKNGPDLQSFIYSIPQEILSEPSEIEKKEVERYLSDPYGYKDCLIEIVTSN